ncbi:MAG: aldo/keto reductase [Ectothiorhodospiraceae bacterium]|nr:aldo/keto reductase [Ectothiorhodospiraceae bacterium]
MSRIDELPVVVEIARKHERTPFQVAIRWALQHRSVTIPKSVNPDRIAENADVFSFELTQEEMERIDALDRNERIGPDPDEFPMNWA